MGTYLKFNQIKYHFKVVLMKGSEMLMFNNATKPY